MTNKQREPLPTINERAGGDPGDSAAHTDHVVPTKPDRTHEPVNNAAFTDNDVQIQAGQVPIDPRQDTLASSGDAATRRNMENPDGTQGAAIFTKGDNAPTFNQINHQGMAATIPDGPLRGADVPAGSGATPLSSDRDAFISDMLESGHFGNQQEATIWARAVFNALRQRALEADKTVARELGAVIRVGEAPEVQVEEMMWGGDYLARMRTMLEALQNPSKPDFYREVAKDMSRGAADPWVEAAVFSFFGALKRRLSSASNLSNLGELREVWDRAK